MKFKRFCTKLNINKTKRQSIEWVKIFANDSTDKGLMPKVYKQHLYLNIRKRKLKQPNQNVDRSPK